MEEIATQANYYGGKWKEICNSIIHVVQKRTGSKEGQTGQCCFSLSILNIYLILVVHVSLIRHPCVCVCVCVCVWSWWTERQRPSQGSVVMGAGNALKPSGSLSLSEECRTPAIRQKFKPRISLPRVEKIRTRQAKFSMDWGLVGFQGRESGPGDNVIPKLGDQNWDTRLEPVWQQCGRMLRPTMLGAHSLPSSYLS